MTTGVRCLRISCWQHLFKWINILPRCGEKPALGEAGDGQIAHRYGTSRAAVKFVSGGVLQELSISHRLPDILRL